MAFRASDSSGAHIEWSDGEFRGTHHLVREVLALIGRGECVYTVVGGPAPAASAEPEWVAWFTARAALERDPDADSLTWEGDIRVPGEVFEYPPDAVS